MCMCNIPEISQENMSELFVSLDTVRVYIYDRISYCPQKDVHPPPEGWAQGQHHGVMPITKKFEAIQALAVPKTCKTLRQFIDMINFYRDM